MDGGREVGRSQRETGGRGEEGGSLEGGREGGRGSFYLFIFHPQLNFSPMMVDQGPVQLPLTVQMLLQSIRGGDSHPGS